MNIKEIVNVSRYLDNILITSLSNIILDYIINNEECSVCNREFHYINDYPCFKIVSVDISEKYPKYIRDWGEDYKYLGENEFDKIKNVNFVEFRSKYGKKLKSFYDPINNLIYGEFGSIYYPTVRQNISGKENVKTFYEKCVKFEQKRLQIYDDIIGITLKNKDLFKYLKLPTNYDGGYDTCTESIKLFDGVYVSYSLDVREGNIFKFVSYISSKQGWIRDFSEITVEGIY